MLGAQVSYIKKKKDRKKKKHIFLDFINKPIPFHLWFDRVEIWKRGSNLE